MTAIRRRETPALTATHDRLGYIVGYRYDAHVPALAEYPQRVPVHVLPDVFATDSCYLAAPQPSPGREGDHQPLARVRRNHPRLHCRLGARPGASDLRCDLRQRGGRIIGPLPRLVQPPEETGDRRAVGAAGFIGPVMFCQPRFQAGGGDSQWTHLLVGGETIDTVTKWAEEYLAVAAGLCERAERDLDILALDIEHRIIRPFSAVLDAIRSDATDAATQALEQ